MRMPIGRGFPSTSLYFTVPKGAGDTLFRVSMFARVDSPVPDRVARVDRYLSGSGNAKTYSLGSVDLVPDQYAPQALLLDYPISGEGNLISVTPAPHLGQFRVWGHVEIDDVDMRVPDRPFITQKPVAPFLTPVLSIGVGDPETEVHRLADDYVDLVSLQLIMSQPNLDIELRFYDGRYLNGRALYETVTTSYKDQDNPVRGPLLDRHPMRGPGRITAVATDGDADKMAFVLGTVLR
jgi:hypothetical protein